MKARFVEIAASAANDIIEQADWYETGEDPRLARRWESAITETILFLLDFPASGAICRVGDALPPGVRRIPVHDFPRYLIFYRVTGVGIHILRVLHGARGWDAFFD